MSKDQAQLDASAADGATASAALAQRTAERRRVTRETDVAIALNLDALPEDPNTMAISSSVPFLDHLLSGHSPDTDASR